MKVALITDQHFGVRSDSKIFLEYFEKFYNEVFFPYLKEHNITAVIDLGDTFDRRKFINFSTLHHAQKMWFDKLKENNIKLHMIVGNHTIYYKNTLKVNSPELLLSDKYDNITVYSEPKEITIDGHEILMLPWICSDNSDQIFSMIKSSTADTMMAHLELNGFEMYKGQYNQHGFTYTSVFKKFTDIFTGHYHTKSSRDNITYLGAPYEMTWADYKDERGFHVYDTSTQDLERVVNPNHMFYKIMYDDSVCDTFFEDFVKDIPFHKYKDKICKVIVKTKNNSYWFDMFIDKITEQGVSHLQVVEDHLYLDVEDDEDIISNAEDTLTVLSQYVNQLEIKPPEKIAVDKLLRDVYNDVLTMV